MRPIVARFIVFGLLILGLSRLTVLAQTESDTHDRSKPVWIEKVELASALLLVERGSLVQLSPQDFQALQTATVRRPNRLLPKVIAARYRARYVGEVNGEANLSGTAEWVVRRPPTSSAVIPLDGLQIALRQAKWSDGNDAILYKRSPDSLTRLYVPEGDERALNLEWSTRGINEPGEIRFDLGVPPFPIATLELELPVGLTPVLPQAEAVLTGPFPAAAAGEHTWRIAFGGISRLEILLRRTSEATTPLFARLSSSQILNGTEALARFEFQVESAKTGFSEMQFAHDLLFVPTGVTANNLVSWSPVIGDPAKPSILVRLREPTRSATVVISGTATVSASPDEWQSPGVQLVNGILRSEKLALSVGPSLELRDLKLRDFTLVKSEQEMDRSYHLVLEPGLVTGPSPQQQRPSIIVSPRGQAAWTASQQSVWNVGRVEERLEVLTSVNAANNSPRVLRFGIPSGWLVDRVEWDNREANWWVSGPSKKVLEVDLGPTVKKGEFVTHLRRSRTETSQETLALPDLFPEGSSNRSGMLKIVVDPAADAVLSDPIPSLTTNPPAAMSRELASIPLSGQLSLSHAPARHRVAIESAVQAIRGGMAITSTMSIGISSGSVSEISLWTPSQIEGDWEWRDEAGRWIAQAVRSPIDETITSLHGLSSQPTLPMFAARHATSLAGYRWKLRFSSPLVRDTKLLSTYVSHAKEARLPLPIAWSVGVPFSGLVLSSSALTADQREPRWAVSAASESGGYEYRYGEQSALSHGTIPEVWTPQFRNARTVHSIDAQGACRVSFRCQVRRWTQGNLPLTLPEGASEPEVLVAGRPSQTAIPQGSRVVEISVPRGNSWTSVEVRYQVAIRPGFLSTWIPRLTPEGPFDPDAVRGIWQMNSAWRALVPSSWQVIPGTGDTRQNLPAPDWRAFVDRSRLVPVNWKSERTIVDTLAFSHIDKSAIESTDSKVAQDSYPGGIVVVERRDGVLVTTRETLDNWRFEAGWFELLPKEIEAAIAEALQQGSDASGRFVSREHWDSKSIAREDPFDAASGWWVYEDSGSASGSPQLLHRERISCGSWLVSILLAGGILVLTRNRLCSASLVFCLLATSAIWFAFPVLRHEVAGPALFVFVVANLIRLFPSPGTIQDGARVSNASVRAGVTVVSLTFLVATGNGADTNTNQISEIRDREGRASSYLVPVSLFERTREANGQTPHVPVIFAANYSGSRVGKMAELRASYRLHCFEDGVGRITLPILGARFRSVTLDGAEARDVDAGPDGLRVAVAGKGDHTLELQFTIGINATGNERELRVSIPEVPISRLLFELIGTATPLQLSGWRGGVTHSAIPGGQKLEADLGTSTTITVRWTEDSGVKASTRAKQASVWQITPQSATLNALIEYRMSGGGASTFQLAIPANCEVSRLVIRADSTSATGASARIRDWNVGPADGNGERSLTIQTLTPITNRVIFLLELTLATPPRQNNLLLLPRPLGVVDSETFAATSLDNLEERIPATLGGLIEASVDSFSREVWSSLDGAPFPGKVTAAYRSDGKLPSRLAFSFRTKITPRIVSDSINWWVEPGRLIGKAETRWKGSEMSTMEWTLPTDYTVMEVSGKGVASWSQVPGKVRVWLDVPVNELTLNWLAVRARASNDALRVTIPAIVHTSATEMVVQSHVRTGNGLSLSPSERTLPGQPLPARVAGELAWSMSRPASVNLIAHLPQVGAAPSIRTTVKPIDDRIQIASLVNLDALARGRPHLLSVQIGNCADCTVEVMPPPLWKITEGPPRSVERHWEIEIPAEDTGSRALNIVVTPREPPRDSWPLPRITVRTSGASRQAPNQVFVVNPASISIRPEVGLTRISAAEWRVVDREWKGTATRRIDSARDELVRNGRHEIFVDRAGGTWIYRANYSIQPNQSGLLRITAPSGTTSFSCEANGNPVRIEDGNARLQVQAETTQLISASWSSSEPRWNGVRFALDGTEFFEPEMNWRVRVPQGWVLELPGEGLLVGPHIQTSRSEAKLDVEARSAGTWHEFRASPYANIGPNLMPHRSKEPIWPLVVAGSILVAWVLLCWILPLKSKSLQASIVAILAAFLLGPSAGLFLLVPLAVAALGFRRLLNWLVRLMRPRDLAGATF